MMKFFQHHRAYVLMRRFLSARHLKTIAQIMAAAILLCGCGNADLPIGNIQRSLANAPSYFILLEDMKEEGNFFQSYFHKYRILQDRKSGTTQWLEVPKDYYMTNEAFLGMVIAGKNKEEPILSAQPLAYQYVGDERHGRWRNDGNRSLWEFDRGSPLFEELDIDIAFPIYKKNYDAYQRSTSKKIPFLGTNREYGTNGSITKKKKPGFFERHQAKERLKKASFKEKVGKRIGRTTVSKKSVNTGQTTVSKKSVKTGRTRTGFRGRSGSRGK